MKTLDWLADVCVTVMAVLWIGMGGLWALLALLVVCWPALLGIAAIIWACR